MPCRMSNTYFIQPRAVDTANLREIGHRTTTKLLLPPRIVALCGSQTIEVTRVETLSFKGPRLLIQFPALIPYYKMS
jgi:hypothetical protein